MKKTAYQNAMRKIAADEAEIRTKAHQIQAQYNAQHPARRTNRGFRIGLAAAAAVILCGTVTAGAVSDWDYAALFRKYFSDKTGTEISYDFSGMGLDIGQQYEGEGYTLTVQGVIADQNAVYTLYEIALDESVREQTADYAEVVVIGGLSACVIKEDTAGSFSPVDTSDELVQDENGIWHGVRVSLTDPGTDLSDKALEYTSTQVSVINRNADGTEADYMMLPEIGEGYPIGTVSLADITVQKGIERECSVILPEDRNKIEFTELCLTPMQLSLRKTGRSYDAYSAKNPLILGTDDRIEEAEAVYAVIYADGTELPLEGNRNNSSVSSRNDGGYDSVTRSSLIFNIPVDLTDVTAVRIGETVIPVAP